MTRDEIMTLEGRELDAKIAEGVFAHTTCVLLGEMYTLQKTTIGTVKNLIPSYSTDIAAAWQVVEKMRSWHVAMTITTAGPSNQTAAYTTSDSKAARMVWAATPPLAICRAALCAIHGA